VYPEHVALLQQRQDELLKDLEELARAGFTKAEEEWQRSVTLWDKRQEKARLDAENVGSVSAVVGTNRNGSASAAPTRDTTEENDGMDVDTPLPSASAPPGTQGANAAAHPPAKKFRLTEQMKAIIWDLVLLSNECCRLENEKNQYEGSVIQVSDQGLRKVLYQKIVAAFPDGWMSSGQISRDGEWILLC
jgi:Ubinuclein conserved middle domain